jgi:hypothetical protein
MQAARSTAVHKQRLVVHAVRVIGSETGRHALVLVEQSLVVRNLPSSNPRHAKRHL